MKRTVDEHAARFDQKADKYDTAERPIYASCRDQVIEAADPASDEVVLDLGAGTGAIALALAAEADRVVARDISTGMLTRAREKAREAGNDSIDFATGSFREPNYAGRADVVTSNYALHHLDDDGKREAIARIARYRPRRFVLGDVMFFGEPDPDDPNYDPDVDDPATVGVLVEAMTDCGFEIVDVVRITDQTGVIVADEPRVGWEQ